MFYVLKDIEKKSLTMAGRILVWIKFSSEQNFVLQA